MTRARALAEAARIFEELGITATALHLAERTGARFTDPTGAMEMLEGTP